MEAEIYSETPAFTYLTIHCQDSQDHSLKSGTILVETSSILISCSVNLVKIIVRMETNGVYVLVTEEP
jgi:hypothetical protein